METPEEYYKIGADIMKKKTDNGLKGEYFHHDAIMLGLMQAGKDFLSDLRTSRLRFGNVMENVKDR